MGAVLRAEALAAFSHALRQLPLAVLHNAGCSAADASARVELAAARWRGRAAAGPSAWLAGAQWESVEWCPLAGVDVEAGCAADEASRLVHDALPAKLAVLHASVDVLEQVLLSDVLLVNRPQA